MNQATLQQSGKGYNVATVGNLSTFEGKAFLKEVIGTTGMGHTFPAWRSLSAHWLRVKPFPSSIITS